MTETELKDKAAAQFALNLITLKLKRVIVYLAQTKAVAGRLSPSDQYAIRILKSRQRELLRMYQLRWGTPKEQYRARIEMSLRTPDCGQLFDLNGLHHGVGRLDCAACATEMTDQAPIPTSMARLCPQCKQGVQHVYYTTMYVGPEVEQNIDEHWHVKYTYVCENEMCTKHEEVIQP